jgi:sulfhydrogenase subunit alpha
MTVGTRTLNVSALTRVEGEGALHVALNDGELESVQLNIYEPPRFFEAVLRALIPSRRISRRG